MKTVTYSDVLNLAAELAGRADDTTTGGLRLTPSEAILLRTLFASELPDLWESEAWPELCDHVEAVTLDSDSCFSLREGAADEMGSVLALVASGDPRVTTIVTVLPRERWTRLDDRVNVVGPVSGSLYVDWQTPCPDLMDDAVVAPALADYELPVRFKLPLAARGAALLLAEEDPVRAATLRALAAQAMMNQASRLTRPWWRR